MFYERSGFHVFTVGRIDVFVSLWYLLIMAFIIFSPGLGGGAQMGTAVADGILLCAAITLGLLVHEFGHAVVSKTYALAPSILLHGFGGLCMHEPADSDGKDALILLAGPGAGLALGAIGWVVLTNVALGPALTTFTGYVVWVCIVWNLLNLLLPIYPLDGGKLFHLLLRRFLDDSQAQALAMRVSIAVTVLSVVALYAYFQYFSLFITLMAFFIVMDNVRTLQSNRAVVERASNAGEPDDFQVDLLDDAKEAADRGDWNEAYRLCHQLRSTGGKLTDDVLEEVWRLLAISSVEIGRCDEAESYFKRAPETSEVEAAREKCERKLAED